MESGQIESGQECMPCRGSGRVISNLGGQPSQVECPWCGGSGVRRSEGEVDAQARWSSVNGDGGDPVRDAPSAESAES